MMFFDRFSTSMLDDFVVSSYQGFSKSKTRFIENSNYSVLSGEGYLPLKRIMDIVFGISLLILSLPTLTLCALAIKLTSPGPVFLHQERTGKGKKIFKAYKLRTMVKNAAELREKYLHLNELKLPDFKLTNDPRVTMVGRFLRRFSLDELPQLINVIKGDMSLVGPRPSTYNAGTYYLWQTERFALKPGITGLAQVNGRRLLLDDKVRYDIAYYRNISPWLDFKILIITLIVVLGTPRAY